MEKIKAFNWGIIGCGKIAEKFAESLEVIPSSRLFAVASKSGSRASHLAGKFGASHHFNSYRQLVEMPEIDAIYIATTHNYHYENAVLCLKAGKPVLCEKPLTVNASETQDLIRLAREKRVFLMEAFWTRFIPASRKLLQLIDEGIIGETRMIKADFGYDFPFDATSRVYDPGLAGGALLDVGIYPINFSQMIFRKDPVEIRSLATIGKTGIDEQSAYIFRYPEGEISLMHSAVNLETRHDAWIYGSLGHIHVPRFYCPSKFHVSLNSGENKTLEVPFLSTGYSYEAEEVMDCLRKGRLESGIMPLSESLKIMEMMDNMRKTWEMKYPNDANFPEI